PGGLGGGRRVLVRVLSGRAAHVLTKEPMMRSDTGTRTPAWLLLLGAAVLVVLIVWAASRWADQTEGTGFATGEPITVEGCLTARPDGAAFVLTPSELN